ncbi:MAG: CPBP family intramembrane metalloprotease, partial [Anaerolineales bacterium]|nr:CPBP family intramembrane metalloprotease [Anaerolineales bacterium]
PVVLLSSLSFAAIHGVFLPDKLLVTFLLGIISTVYYLKERNLAPLMLTHWFVDMWSFGLFMFG